MSTELNEFKFDGKGWPLFKLYISNLLLTILTLGIYYFWAKVKTKKFFYNHTVFQNGRFDYHVTGKEKFIAFLKGVLVVGVLYGVLFFGLTRLLQKLGVDQTASIIIIVLVFYAGFFLILPAVIYGIWKFRLARSSWNSVHFRFYGRTKDIYKIVLKGIFFSLFTLGIYTPWYTANIRRYMIGNSAIGSSKFSYDGNGKELFWIMFTGFLLTLVTLGFYASWFSAKLERYHWKHTTFQDIRFVSRMAGLGLFSRILGSMLITVLTLGLALPWATIMIQKYTIECLAMEGRADTAAIEASPDTHAGAFSEGMSEAADFLDALGDFFA